ncbi:MAG: CcmD family protein [Nitrospiraceae bacterium]|nr:MAG: CcmD family protein [Nitrospiraceae bacterium]
MNNWYYLVGAYTIAWVGIMVYISGNIKKLKVAEEKLKDLEEKICRDI